MVCQALHHAKHLLLLSGNKRHTQCPYMPSPVSLRANLALATLNAYSDTLLTL